MQCWLCRALSRFLLPFLLLLSQAAVRADIGDDQVLAAREAFRKGNEPQLLARIPAVRGHPLEPYVHYWALRLHPEQLSQDQVDAFLTRWPGTMAGEKLKLDWLKQLAKRQDWPHLLIAYRDLESPDDEAVCHALRARRATGEEEAAGDARRLWLTASELPASCKPLFDSLVADHLLSADDVWMRIRRSMEMRRLEQAESAARYLNHGPRDKELENLLEAPELFLNRMRPGFAVRREGREMAMIAVARLAHSDPERAASRWESIRGRFSSAERGYVYGQLGWQGALDHLPQAERWYRAAEDTPLTEEQMAWKARAALRAEDWKALAPIIRAMPVELASRSEWVYWLGRALKSQGKLIEANDQFAKLAGQPNFYGNLSDEELGHLIDVPPTTKPEPQEVAAVAAAPGIQRALAFYRLDLRTEGSREWNWALRNAGDRFLLAAAELARGEGLYDRAIHTADKTLDLHNFPMRYLAPYRDKIEPATRDLRLDESWVYGLMRQESRFITAAHSGAGARGLMQVMPATARWLADKMGLKNFDINRMADMQTNVLLGTTYMKMVLERLDNHPVLASAAYNAGPGRARKWRAARPLEGAIYVETIPFTETRNYVKKVMSNAVYYAALFEKKPQSLKERLGVIRPEDYGSDRANLP